MTYIIAGHMDEHVVITTAKNPREAFLEAIDWQARNLTRVTISEGARSYTLQQFAETMALSEFACATGRLKAQS